MFLIVTTTTTQNGTKGHVVHDLIVMHSVLAHPFRSPCVDDLPTMIQAESQHSFLSPKHTVQRPVTASIGVYGKRLPNQHRLTAQYLSLTISHVVGDDSTVFTISHVEPVLGGVEGELVRDEETSVVDGILPRLKELATCAEFEDTTVAIAVS